MFGTTGWQGFNIEIHYDNPLFQSGVVDSSGVEFYYATTPRSVEVGLLQLADPGVTLQGRGVGDGFSKHAFSCPGSCSQLFLDEPITVIREHLHMHQIGTRMTQEQIRNGKVVRTGTIEVWDFDQNGNAPVQQDPYEILPGDSFKTTCYYDSSKKRVAGDVDFGLASSDEMCISFLYYYPQKIFTTNNNDNYPWICGPEDTMDNSSCTGTHSEALNLQTTDLQRIFGKKSCGAAEPPPPGFSSTATVYGRNGAVRVWHVLGLVSIHWVLMNRVVK